MANDFLRQSDIAAFVQDTLKNIRDGCRAAQSTNGVQIDFTDMEVAFQLNIVIEEQTKQVQTTQSQSGNTTSTVAATSSKTGTTNDSQTQNTSSNSNVSGSSTQTYDYTELG